MGHLGGTDPSAVEEPTVTDLLDHLLDDLDPGTLAGVGIDDLRGARDRYQEIEAGLSFGRRLVQGRLDIVICEVERRSSGGAESLDDLMARLPSALSRHTRGSGTPRPVRDTQLPLFADALTREADSILDPNELAQLAQVSDDRIDVIMAELQAFEQQVSAKRHEVHRIIDEIQEEIVSRYRTGAASVDDLLR